MKTSNKLLISLLIISLLTLIGSAKALKMEYDRIDFNDPYYGFSTISVKPFRVLKIDGNKMTTFSTVNSLPSLRTMGIQMGKAFEIRRHKDSKLPFSYRSVGDTLLIQYEPEYESWPIGTDQFFRYTPFAYVIAPSVQTIIAHGTTCKLANLHTKNLSIIATNARMLISKSSIDNLTVTGQRGSLLQTGVGNWIRSASITSRDSTGFVAERNSFDSLTLTSDSTATVKVPASLLKKL